MYSFDIERPYAFGDSIPMQYDEIPRLFSEVLALC